MDSKQAWFDLVQESLKKTEELYNAQKYDEVSQFYAEDVRLFPPGAPETQGREALIKAHREVSDHGGSRAEVSDVEILHETGDWALAKHAFKLTTEQGRLVFMAKMIHSWKFKNGKAQITTTMWNFDDAIQL